MSSLAVLLAAGMPTLALSAEGPSTLLGALQAQSAIDGCSWSAESSAIGKGFIFLAEYDQSDVLMNIRSVDVHLSRDPTRTRGALKKVGGTLREVYDAPGIRVEAVFTATRLCGPKDPACEVTKFNVVFKVRAGDEEQIVAGTGDVGC